MLHLMTTTNDGACQHGLSPSSISLLPCLSQTSTLSSSTSTLPSSPTFLVTYVNTNSFFYLRQPSLQKSLPPSSPSMSQALAQVKKIKFQIPQTQIFSTAIAMRQQFTYRFLLFHCQPISQLDCCNFPMLCGLQKHWQHLFLCCSSRINTNVAFSAPGRLSNGTHSCNTWDTNSFKIDVNSQTSCTMLPL